MPWSLHLQCWFLLLPPSIWSLFHNALDACNYRYLHSLANEKTATLADETGTEYLIDLVENDQKVTVRLADGKHFCRHLPHRKLQVYNQQDGYKAYKNLIMEKEAEKKQEPQLCRFEIKEVQRPFALTLWYTAKTYRALRHLSTPIWLRQKPDTSELIAGLNDADKFYFEPINNNYSLVHIRHGSQFGPYLTRYCHADILLSTVNSLKKVLH